MSAVMTLRRRITPGLGDQLKRGRLADRVPLGKRRRRLPCRVLNNELPSHMRSQPPLDSLLLARVNTCSLLNPQLRGQIPLQDKVQFESPQTDQDQLPVT